MDGLTRKQNDNIQARTIGMLKKFRNSSIKRSKSIISPLFNDRTNATLNYMFPEHQNRFNSLPTYNNDKPINSVLDIINLPLTTEEPRKKAFIPKVDMREIGKPITLASRMSDILFFIPSGVSGDEQRYFFSNAAEQERSQSLDLQKESIMDIRSKILISCFNRSLQKLLVEGQGTPLPPGGGGVSRSPPNDGRGSSGKGDGSNGKDPVPNPTKPKPPTSDPTKPQPPNSDPPVSVMVYPSNTPGNDLLTAAAAMGFGSAAAAVKSPKVAAAIAAAAGTFQAVRTIVADRAATRQTATPDRIGLPNDQPSTKSSLPSPDLITTLVDLASEHAPVVLNAVQAAAIALVPRSFMTRRLPASFSTPASPKILASFKTLAANPKTTLAAAAGVDVFTSGIDTSVMDAQTSLGTSTSPQIDIGTKALHRMSADDPRKFTLTQAEMSPLRSLFTTLGVPGLGAGLIPASKPILSSVAHPDIERRSITPDEMEEFDKYLESIKQK